MTSDGSVYFSGTLEGDSSFVVYPFSTKNTSLKGQFFGGNAFSNPRTYQKLGNRLVLSPGGANVTVKAGTTLTIYGRK